MATFNTFWLGQPGTMQTLPAASVGYSRPAGRAEGVHSLIAGGTSVTRHLHQKRAWALSWVNRSAGPLDVLQGFYRGVYGDGPFSLIDPADTNLLPLDTTLCGARFGLLGTWTSTTGAVAASAVVGPTPPAGTLQWTPTAAGYLFGGVWASSKYTPDSSGGVPFLTGVPVTVSMWVWTVSGTASVSVNALGVPVAGTASPVAVTGTVTTATTTPQRLSVTVAVGASGWSQAATPSILAALHCTGATTLYVSAPQVEYAAAASGWLAGSGVPRVVVGAGMPRTVNAILGSDTSLSLLEI